MVKRIVRRAREGAKAATETRPRSGKRPTAVGAYIFAGLWTIGAQKHFGVLGHLEDGSFGTATARRNFKFPVHEVQAEWPLEDFDGVDYMFANPPCAPWSNANSFSSEWKDNPLTACMAKTMRAFKRLQPRVLMIESVRGAFTKGRPMIDAMAKEARALGYQVSHVFTDAQNHGVPQVRKRYFFVAHDVELKWPAPSARVVTSQECLDRARKWKDQEGLAKMPDRFVDMLPRLEPGGKLRSLFDEENGIKDGEIPVGLETSRGTNGAEKSIKGRPSFLINRLHPTKPGNALTGSATKIHTTKDRFVTVAEMKSLCIVPEDFKFEGCLSSKYAQVAKAVMPPVGEYVAAVAADGIKRARPADPDRREQVWVHADRVEMTKEVDSDGE